MLKTRRKPHIWYILVVGYVISPSLPAAVHWTPTRTTLGSVSFLLKPEAGTESSVDGFENGCEKSIAIETRRLEIRVQGRNIWGYVGLGGSLLPRAGKSSQQERRVEGEEPAGAVARAQAARAPHRKGEQASFRSLAARDKQSPRRGRSPCLKETSHCRLDV